MRRSAQEIDALIDRELERGVPISRIVLGGFSQGGVMSLFAGLRRRDRLAGIVCLSGYLTGDEIDPDRPLPVFLAHGTRDAVVPPAWGQVSAESLTKAGYPAEWHAYPMEHTVCAEELQAIGRWLTRILGFDPSGP